MAMADDSANMTQFERDLVRRSDKLQLHYNRGRMEALFIDIRRGLAPGHPLAIRLIKRHLGELDGEVGYAVEKALAVHAPESLVRRQNRKRARPDSDRQSSRGRGDERSSGHSQTMRPLDVIQALRNGLPGLPAAEYAATKLLLAELEREAAVRRDSWGAVEHGQWPLMRALKSYVADRGHARVIRWDSLRHDLRNRCVEGRPGGGSMSRRFDRSELGDCMPWPRRRELPEPPHPLSECSSSQLTVVWAAAEIACGETEALAQIRDSITAALQGLTHVPPPQPAIEAPAYFKAPMLTAG